MQRLHVGLVETLVEGSENTLCFSRFDPFPPILIRPMSHPCGHPRGFPPLPLTLAAGPYSLYLCARHSPYPHPSNMVTQGYLLRPKAEPRCFP